jgi:hypothetical protein
MSVLVSASHVNILSIFCQWIMLIHSNVLRELFMPTCRTRCTPQLNEERYSQGAMQSHELCHGSVPTPRTSYSPIKVYKNALLDICDYIQLFQCLYFQSS